MDRRLTWTDPTVDRHDIIQILESTSTIDDTNADAATEITTVPIGTEEYEYLNGPTGSHYYAVRGYDQNADEYGPVSNVVQHPAP